MARAKKPSTTGDLVRSMLVILIPLAVITYLFTDLPNDHPVKVVDWKPVVAAARANAPYPILAPTDFPEGWRPTQANWVKLGDPDQQGQKAPGDLYELGVLNPDDVYLGLSQSDEPGTELIEEKTRKGTEDGTSLVNGTTWERRISPDERTRSLVQLSAKVNTIVSGDLSYAALEAYAVTLTTS